MTEPSAEEFKGWMHQPSGKYFRQILKDKMQELQDDWANGQFSSENSETTIQLNSEALGKVQQIADILLTIEELSTDDTSREDTEY